MWEACSYHTKSTIAGTLRRHINHSVACVRLVLDKLVRAISVDYSVALLLIFAEVVLTRGPDILYAGLVDDRAVVIVSYEDLIELLEYLCGQLLVVRLC